MIIATPVMTIVMINTKPEIMIIIITIATPVITIMLNESPQRRI